MAARIPVRELRIGMFVTELDRSWLDSPFLFQGFLIETEDELGALQALCDYVLIEEAEEESTPGSTQEQDNGHPVRNRIGSFRDSFTGLHSIHRRMERGLIKLLSDRRIGRLINTDSVRASVNELLDSILANPDAALWLTKLRTEDERTATHCLNVAIISLAFAHHLGMTRKEMEAVGLGAILHDVGLSNEANDAIRQARSLSEKEFDLIKQHPATTLDMLDDPDRLPQMTLDILRWHHERIDGSGYPDGLSGTQIPRHALLVGLADSYDAMASDRAYRKARQPPEVLNELYRVADTQFGKPLVEAFIQGIGIYPPGTVVRLSTGAIGVVASSDTDSRLEPLVLVVRDGAGRWLHPYHLVDLQNISRKVGKKWKIVEVVDPDSVRINLAEIVADEMRAFGS